MKNSGWLWYFAVRVLTPGTKGVADRKSNILQAGQICTETSWNELCKFCTLKVFCIAMTMV